MEIEVKKIHPVELPKKFFYRLNYVYKINLFEFIVVYDSTEMKLYVNEERVPDEDIEKFQQVLNYQGKYINEPDSEVSDILDFICQKYGSDIYLELVEGYMDRKKYEKNEEAERKAPVIVKMIEEFMQDDENEFSCSDKEYLIYHIKKLVRKNEKKSLHNMIGYDNFYVLLYGYFMGKGIIK